MEVPAGGYMEVKSAGDIVESEPVGGNAGADVPAMIDTQKHTFRNILKLLAENSNSAQGQ
jgi:hypothetical protein